jgi:adenylate cyclase
MNAHSGDTSAAVGWLMDGARSVSTPDAVLAELCARLAAEGMPLWRVSVFVRTLHPDVMGRRFTWMPGHLVEIAAAPYRVLELEEYRTSPFVRVVETGAVLRRRLADKDCPIDFDILKDFAADGVTDYLAAPLPFINGETHVVTWTTRAPGGFTDAEAQRLVDVAAPLARVAEIYALRRTARNLLETYVGAHAGARILEGHIRRGDTDAIEAAIWLSDMRGFTALADRIEPAALVALLNRYFEAQVPAIARHGGTVLKFIGDGLLAIFPAADRGREAACAAALAAAREARAAIASIEAGDGARVRFGLALHIGTLLYGNIGAAGRLDFTCIGPAVNLAARIEKLAGELGRTLLASSAFAALAPGLEPVGRFAVRGIDEAQRVFGLAEESDRGP